MSAPIINHVGACEAVRVYENYQKKEPMAAQCPSWQKIELDLFHFGYDDFLITTVFYSNYFEVDKLKRKLETGDNDNAITITNITIPTGMAPTPNSECIYSRVAEQEAEDTDRRDLKESEV